MKRIILAMISLFSAIASHSAHADETQWQSLFNGRDLSGWRANVLPESWTVVDGAIRANATAESSHLFYVGDLTKDSQPESFVRFKNFELEVVTRSEKNANSGIFFHTDWKVSNRQNHLANGYEVQLNSSNKEKRKTGSLYAVKDLDVSPVDESQWFTTRIRVRDKHIEVWLNDKQVIDYIEPPNVIDERPEKPTNRKGRVLNPLGGAIALQGHDPGSVFYFKTIRLRPLP